MRPPSVRLNDFQDLSIANRESRVEDILLNPYDLRRDAVERSKTRRAESGRVGLPPASQRIRTSFRAASPSASRSPAPMRTRAHARIDVSAPTSRIQAQV